LFCSIKYEVSCSNYSSFALPSETRRLIVDFLVINEIVFAPLEIHLKIWTSQFTKSEPS